MHLYCNETTLNLLFNKGLSKENRDSILMTIKDLFGLESPVPTDYDGIPVLNSLNATYYRFINERDQDDIDDLWKLFVAALTYDKEPTEKNKVSFSEYFSRVIKTKGNGNAKITMGLFWIAPETFLNLDSRNKWYIYEADQLPKEFVLTLPKIPDRLTSAIYFEVIDKVNAFISSGSSPLRDFKDLSQEAWRYSEEINEKIKKEKEASQAKAKEDGLADSDVRTTHYWMIAPGSGAHKWDEFYQKNIIGIGWDEMGDLSLFTSKEEMLSKMKEVYGPDRSYTNDVHATWQFANEMKPGDIIYIKKGLHTLLGRGVVISDYEFDESMDEYKSVHHVDWTHHGEWPHDDQIILKTLTDITQYTSYVQDLEALFQSTDIGQQLVMEELVQPTYPAYNSEQFLKDVFMDRAAYDTLVGLIRKKKNVILQGAPGVGKTYAAKRLAYSMMGEKNQDRVMMVQFHQSYSYEDFIEGFRPTGSGSGFEIKKGTFYHFCRKAADDPDNEYFFIIDEINRGNLSRIFGELFMLIENDKRGNELQLLYSDEKFNVPRNVYILGMMNTADRSLAMLDYALRRRFAFFDMKPAFGSAGFREYRAGLNSDKFNHLIECVERLNTAIKEDESLGEGFCIGHSYFCNLEEVTDQALTDIVKYELSPLLQEYWYDDRVKANDWISRLKDAIR